MFFFTLFYFVFSFLMIFPPAEFVSAGLTIPIIFGKYLGSEGERFVEHHITRVIITLTLHSLLPAGYIVLLTLNSTVSPLQDETYGFLWQIYTTLAIIPPSAVLWTILKWSSDSWAHHPICKKLGKFCNLGEHWTIVASNVNIEFRRYDKVIIQTSSTTRAYVTDNWIIKVGLYTVDFAHQSDAILIVNNTDIHDISPTGSEPLQYINIEVKSTGRSIDPFSIRLLAQDFKDLEDKVRRPIVILPNIGFYKTRFEKFLDVFKEQVALNQKYTYNEELERCICCMQEISNVKLVKQCSQDVETPRSDPPVPECAQCNCRPMWCVNCMGRWFAARQDQENTNGWLSSKCSCPLCRATFCILDVAFIQTL